METTILKNIIFIALLLILSACVPKAKPAPIPPPVKKLFDIQLIFSEGITESQKEIMNQAANTWEEIIINDFRDLTTQIGEDVCGKGSPAFIGQIDDLVINVSAPDIDGVGKTLGKAGPCGIRKENGIPFYGAIIIDAADINMYETQGKLKDLVMHEMGHVLGIGTLWERNDLIRQIGPNNFKFSGRSAVKEWQELGQRGHVPLANRGGTGTKLKHWREVIFDTELMTGFSDPEEQLSRITIGSLEDLGYKVDFSLADNYSLPVPSLRVLTADPDLVRPHLEPTTFIFEQ